MATNQQIREGQILTGSLFNEPMRVETVASNGPESWVVGLVGTQSEKFRKVTLTAEDLESLTIHDTTKSYDGDGQLLRLGLQAYALGIAYEFDPYFGLSISRVDPLPHQLEAVYDYLLKLARVRFLLADDAGAGKTIMAGLLIRELKLRGLAERILIVCPANLAFQWQRELKEKFDEKFLVMKGSNIRDQFGVNQWLERKQVHHLARPGQARGYPAGSSPGPLGSGDRGRSAPHVLDAALAQDGSLRSGRAAARHHGPFAPAHGHSPQGRPCELQSLPAASRRRRLRRRELHPRGDEPPPGAVLSAAHQRSDGLFPRAAAGRLLGSTKDLHQAHPAHGGLPDRWSGVRPLPRRDALREEQSARAAAQEEDPRARAIGFLMSLYQRRLASSTYAMRRSLENRARRLEEALKAAQQLARLAPPDLPDPEELEEMEESERERLEAMLEAITLAGNAEQVQEEIAELRRLAAQAKAVEDAGAEAKLSHLKELLQKEGFFDHPDQRLLLFTEFKDTLDYLVEVLKTWGFRVGFIHGGMKSGSRDEPGQPALTPSSSSGKARSRSSSRPRRPARESTSRSATSSSTTTSRGTRTGWSSGWAASTATASARTA